MTNTANSREIRLSTSPQKFETRKAADGTRTVSGYFATFGTLSHPIPPGFVEVIKPGAFAQSLRNNPDVMCFVNHNTDQLLGRVSSGTLTVAEDTIGLRFSVTMPATTYANDLIALMERGDIGSCSFGFSLNPDGTGDEWSETADGQILRTLTSVTLWEGSIVLMPAYPKTSANLRSCPLQFRSRLIRSTDAKLKSVDGIELPASCFAYVGDPDLVSTWAFPIDFPGDQEKTKQHLQLALDLFKTDKGVPADKKSEVWSRIVAAAKAAGVKVNEQDRDSEAECIAPCNESQDVSGVETSDRELHLQLLLRRLRS